MLLNQCNREVPTAGGMHSNWHWKATCVPAAGNLTEQNSACSVVTTAPILREKQNMTLSDEDMTTPFTVL
jgi:hypothetical protein